ncbi:hypothetical protein CK203_101629 [Vitis vinifera]|uniref:Uncharacterized protein n=1 Tax=Vitis vinifera TaxID=29760 RepID=A0A438DYU9_VITVI|nr:hypothetical protein CK203_101629 [Vitis vinifera]
MLKGVSCFTDAEAPSTKMSDFFPLTKQEWMMPKTVEVLFKQLEVAEAMRAFISYHSGDIEEMHSKLERVEADLTAA